MGFLVATRGDIPVGFAHAAFGPSDDFESISNENGIVSMIMVNPIEDADETARELLLAAENYLIEGGAKRIHAVG